MALNEERMTLKEIFYMLDNGFQPGHDMMQDIARLLRAGQAMRDAKTIQQFDKAQKAWDAALGEEK